MTDLVLTSPMQRFCPLNFNALPDLSEIGYTDTLEVLGKSREGPLQRYLHQRVE